MECEFGGSYRERVGQHHCVKVNSQLAHIAAAPEQHLFSRFIIIIFSISRKVKYCLNWKSKTKTQCYIFGKQGAQEGHQISHSDQSTRADQNRLQSGGSNSRSGVLVLNWYFSFTLLLQICRKSEGCQNLQRVVKNVKNWNVWNES